MLLAVSAAEGRLPSAFHRGLQVKQIHSLLALQARGKAGSIVLGGGRGMGAALWVGLDVPCMLRQLLIPPSIWGFKDLALQVHG